MQTVFFRCRCHCLRLPSHLAGRHLSIQWFFPWWLQSPRTAGCKEVGWFFAGIVSKRRGRGSTVFYVFVWWVGGGEDEHFQKFKMDVKRWFAKQVFSVNIWQVWVAVLDCRSVFLPQHCTDTDVTCFFCRMLLITPGPLDKCSTAHLGWQIHANPPSCACSCMIHLDFDTEFPSVFFCQCRWLCQFSVWKKPRHFPVQIVPKVEEPAPRYCTMQRE